MRRVSTLAAAAADPRPGALPASAEGTVRWARGGSCVCCEGGHVADRALVGDFGLDVPAGGEGGRPADIHEWLDWQVAKAAEGATLRVTVDAVAAP